MKIGNWEAGDVLIVAVYFLFLLVVVLSYVRASKIVEVQYENQTCIINQEQLYCPVE